MGPLLPIIDLGNLQMVQTQRRARAWMKETVHLSIKLNSPYGPSHQVQVKGLPQHTFSSAGQNNRPTDLNFNGILIIFFFAIY